MKPMPAHILVLSERPEDLTLGQKVAQLRGMAFHALKTPGELRAALIDYPQCLVFWDAEAPQQAEALAPVLMQALSLRRVFAITDGSINQYPHLQREPAFAHHLWRRFDDPAALVYSRLAQAGLEQIPFGVSRYFPENSPGQKIRIERSGHKTAAVEAIQSFLTKQQINTRLAALVAQAADELLMNAIFDAPVDASGNRYRRATVRDSDYDLPGKEQVEVEVAWCDEYSAFSVSDQFGSLKKSTVLGFLGHDYQAESYSVHRQDPGAGLGLYGIVQSGISLLFVSKPGIRTEVMLFFGRGQSYSQFRSGMRFTSIISE